jgi:phosphatidylglycerol:prolipoprotein diacylglycerol transferase
MAMVVAIGIGLGRVANFINAELWGRPTDMPWGVIFPGEAAQACPGPVGMTLDGLTAVCARHPSQLYEAALEGLVMGAVLLWLAWRRGWLKRARRADRHVLRDLRARALRGGVRAPARRAVRRPRQPDRLRAALSPSVGLTMGQILTLPMIALGLWLILRARKPTA